MQNARSTRARDSQRKKVYSADREIPGTTINQLGTNANTQAWVNEVINSRWFRSRWRISILVEPGRGASATSWHERITVGPKARNPWVVLHEVAHEIIWQDTKDGASLAAHGPEFAAIHLFLVGQVMGAQCAQQLRDAYAKHKVKYRSGLWAVPESRYHVTTKAEQRERALMRRPPLTDRNANQAAEVIRQAVRVGAFGVAGSKRRTAALLVARTLAKHATELAS